jgi:hypothetical protein
VLAAALVLGALACAPRVVQAHSVPAVPDPGPTSSFTDATHTYTFRYPANWTLSRPRGFDLVVAAPDGNAAAGAAMAAAPANTTGIDVQVTLGRYAQQFGLPMGTARYGAYRSWNGQTIRYGALATRGSRGTIGIAMVAGTAYGGHTITLYGVIANVQAASWPQDSRQLMGLMDSLNVLANPVQGSGSPQNPSIAATCVALKNQMINFNQLAGMYHGMGDSEYMDDQLSLADYYYQKADWYNRVVQQDYREAVRLGCFG